MESPRTTKAKALLAQAKKALDLVRCGENLVTDPKSRYRFSIFGLWESGEMFVEITDGQFVQVAYFRSRHKGCPPEDRRTEITLVDAADAYDIVRKIIRNWPRTRTK